MNDRAPEASTPDTLTGLFAKLDQLVVTDPAAAATAATGALAMVDRSGTAGERLRLRRMLAMAYTHTNQFDRALATCEAAEHLPGANDATIEIARVRLASMQPLASAGRIDDALQAGKRALDAFAFHDGGDLAGRAALNIGAIYAMTGRPGEALSYFDRARDALANHQVVLGQIETNRGTALAALDRFQEAEIAFARAASLLATGEHSWAVAIAEGNLADLAARQGAFSRSLRHFEASRRSLERDDALGHLGRLNAEEAAVLATMGLTLDARERFVEALALLRANGAPADIAMAQIAYGTVLVAASELDQATDLIDNTAGLIDTTQHADLYRRLLALRARIAIARGHFQEAGERIETGIETVAHLPVQRLRWSIMQAECDSLSGHVSRARSILTTALDTAEQVRVTPLIAEIHQRLAHLARVAGQYDEADTHARKAIAAYESIRGTIQADRLRQSWHQSRLRVYSDLYRSLLDKASESAQREAFGVAEHIRGRMLLDAISSRIEDVETVAPVSGAEQPLVDELVSHRRWLNWMYSSLADGKEPDHIQLSELRHHERAAARLADRLATLRLPSSFASPVPILRVQEQVDDTTVILSYLIVDDRLTVQVVTSHGIHGVANLAPVARIGDLVGRLQFQIGRALVHATTVASPARQARLQRDMDAILEHLYLVLIAPVEQWLNGVDRIVVVPSGELHNVPFAALNRNGSYLIDRFAIATAPGVSVLARMGAPRWSGSFDPARPLIASVPDETAPGLEDEARTVGSRFPTATLLIGTDATRETVLTHMRDADLVHLACHGRFDSAHPTASGLQLADGWLTLDHLLDVRMERPLVVLTGCETGRVRIEDGDDLVGMMAAMIAAGAGGLITSLWKTHDAATVLMTTLYDALDTDGDPVRALRHSQQTVRRQFPHPALWAPFVAVCARSEE